MLAKEPNRCGAAAEGWAIVTNRTPMHLFWLSAESQLEPLSVNSVTLGSAIRQLALIESSNTSRCNRQTGPDHRLAPGPVTRDAGIEKIREAAELAQPTGATEVRASTGGTCT